MQIIYMNGGLGNQLFQYIFYLWLKKLLPGEDIVIDDGKFWGHDIPHHGYELKRIFKLELPSLSQRFTADVWEYMTIMRQQGTDIPEQLRAYGMPLKVIREIGVTNINFNGEIKTFAPGDSLNINRKDNIYWHGHWLAKSFYDFVEKEVKKELMFPPMTDGLNLQLQQKIRRASEPTAIHVRRGDMVKLGWAAPAEYYNRLIKRCEAEYHVSQYLLFSDDIPWCEEHASELGLTDIADRLLVVDNNKGENYWRDLQLMSLCQNRIFARSSFSLLAAFLCNHPQRKEFNDWGRG